jgi:hypothetical protein
MYFIQEYTTKKLNVKLNRHFLLVSHAAKNTSRRLTKFITGDRLSFVFGKILTLRSLLKKYNFLSDKTQYYEI